jgi:hypothetical protein
MTITTQAPAAPVLPAGTCRYPGCAGPARIKGPEAPGRRPGYCEQEVPEDRGDGITMLVRHTAMTAFRRRGQLAGQPDAGGRPVTAAVGRAAAIRDDAVAAMTRLAGQLTAVLDQLSVLGEQLAAVADPEAAEAQAEAVRAEAAAQVGQARADAASQASARHAAELDAAEARAAAAEALTAMETAARGREHAEAAARDAAQALHDAREAAAARLTEAGAAVTAARGERDTARTEAQAARRDAASAREHDQQRHAAELAAVTTRLEAAGTTITGLREQLTRAEAALDRERAEQHKTVTLLHDLLTSRPGAPAGDGPSRPPAGEDPAPASKGSTGRRSPAPQR